MKRSLGIACRLLVSATLLLAATGCQTMVIPVAITAEQMAEVRSRLIRPLPGDLAALYRLRASSAGSLRLSVLTAGEAGRLSINGSFGAAYSLTAWSGAAPPHLYDLRQQCHMVGADASSVIGVARLPLPQALRLLAGRLPMVDGDRLSLYHDGRLLIEGSDWACLASLHAEPWRVIAVEQLRPHGQPGWSITLDDHRLSVPGKLRFEHPQGEWAELDLVSLQWQAENQLPPLPDLPRCVPAP